ncbi:hypothetical protein SALBM217S_05707 [Streptomyces griseoloalbus]
MKLNCPRFGSVASIFISFSAVTELNSRLAIDAYVESLSLFAGDGDAEVAAALCGGRAEGALGGLRLGGRCGHRAGEAEGADEQRGHQDAE